jgi:small subunit ribosomal protein S5
MTEKTKKIEKRSAEEISEELLEKEIDKELEKLEEVDKRTEKEKERDSKIALWVPKTKLGKDVKAKKIKDIDKILDSNQKILEEQIVDALLDLKFDLISIGQSKGKFGGGKRRAWRQTQRKTKEGNIPTFSCLAVVGDENGHVGIGIGKAKETLPARDKAIRKAKLGIIKIKRSCASFDCSCNKPHTVPFKVEGKSGSVRVILIPAPQGTGLVVANELKKVLKLAGIKDVYSKTFGSRRTTINLIKACMNALKKTTKVPNESYK